MIARAMESVRPAVVAANLHRLAMLAAALGGFILLYAAARQFAVDISFAGLSDDAMRSICHFVGYGSLALLLGKAMFNEYLLAWLISMVLATGEEVHQLFIPYRFACIQDWAINATAITLFLLAAWTWGNRQSPVVSHR